ncbi:MAG: hypothetical protein ACK4JY_03895 [Brevundimonas sp.]
MTVKAPPRLIEAVESEPADLWAAGRPAAPIFPVFPDYVPAPEPVEREV